MLQYRAIHKETLELLKELMIFPDLMEFSLAGGTGLAIQLGHRISVDLDLFTAKDFDSEKILNYLISKWNIEIFVKEKNSLNLSINNIKVDILSHKYPNVLEHVILDNIRLYSITDIGLMKLTAIANRGAKKDFYDLYFLLQEYDILQLLELYRTKYKNINSFHLIKSLIYFDDAEIEPDPVLLHDISWEKVKSFFIDLISKKF